MASYGRDGNGCEWPNVAGGVQVSRRGAEYFEQVPNVADVREANINVVGNMMPMLGEVNVRAISIEEVGDSVKEMNRLKLQVSMDFQWSV